MYVCTFCFPALDHFPVYVCVYVERDRACEREGEERAPLLTGHVLHTTRSPRSCFQPATNTLSLAAATRRNSRQCVNPCRQPRLRQVLHMCAAYYCKKLYI